MVQVFCNENTMSVLDWNVVRRAQVVACRTGSEVMGMLKAVMIEVLKAKMCNGVAHFVFKKKDGSIREAWGTTSESLMKAEINGSGIPRDEVNCVCFWDVQKGEFRSFRFENLIQVF